MTPWHREGSAARQRAKEQKAQEAAAPALKSVLDKIAPLDEPDKTNAERVHAVVTKVAPSLAPKLLYGSPAYANADGKTVLFYQKRASLMWPTSFAITKISPADAKAIAKLVPRQSAVE